MKSANHGPIDVKYHTDQSNNTKKCIENLQEIATLQKGDGITCLGWGEAGQTELLIGRANGVVQVYDTTAGVFCSTVLADHGTGEVVGIGRVKRKLITALAGGAVRVWSKKQTNIDTGGPIDRMRTCPQKEGLFATGGKENELKVWDVNASEPVFTAKNIRHDRLELRAPVWPTDLRFLTCDLVAVCSRYGTVRLYDTRAQRRPVCDVAFPNMAATCIAPDFTEQHVLVGFGRGQLHSVDLRGKGRTDKGYKGSVGAVTDVTAVPGTRYIVSSSLDRYLKVHHADTKNMLYKQYLTSKLSCLLAQTETSTPLSRVKEELKEEVDTVTPDGEVPSGDELDDLFEDMETVTEKRQKNKRKLDQNRAKEKLKQARLKTRKEVEPGDDLGVQPEVIVDDTEVIMDDSEADLDEKAEVEDETEANDEQQTEAGIARLLKLTEKKKRKMEKLKKKKKAKSLFHNA